MSASSKKKLRKEQNAAAMTERQKQEAKEAKKLKTYTWTFAIAMILVVCIVVGSLIRIPIGTMISNNTVAVTIGDRKVSSTILNYFYIDGINEYYNEFSDQYSSNTNIYAQLLLGLDFSKPFGDQINNSETNTTWADFFIDYCCDNARSVYAYYDAGKKEGHEMTEEQIKNMEDSITSVETYASMLGYSSADSYLRVMYGKTATMKTYREYFELAAYSSSYYQAHVDALEYDAEDYRAHEKNRYHEYSSYSYVIYNIYIEDYLTGGTEVKNDDGTTSTEYSDEEMEAARKAAEADAKKLSEGNFKTVEELKKAVKALAVNKDVEEDSLGVNEITRLLYSGISNENIAKWVSDDDRVANELAYFENSTTDKDEDGKEVKTINNYYVLMYLGSEENLAPLVDVRHILVKIDGSTTDSTTGNVIYTEEEKNAAKAEAEKILKEWKDGEKTEESFAELAKAKSEDDGSAEEGGLYEGIHYDYGFVEPFANWCLDSSRKEGDAEIIETEHGFHIMYFSGKSDMTYRDYLIDVDLKNAALEAWEESLTKDITITKENVKGIDRDYSLNV